MVLLGTGETEFYAYQKQRGWEIEEQRKKKKKKSKLLLGRILRRLINYCFANERLKSSTRVEDETP